MLKTIAISVVLLAVGSTQVRAQQQPANPQRTLPPPPGTKPVVEKLGENLYRIGELRVDTAKREVSIAGKINRVLLLEFVANTNNGMKAYESAISVNTDGVSFNAALLLIGLDPSHATVPKFHFDPATPGGDPVSISVEWARGSEHQRVPIEQLLFDKVKQEVVPSAGWVYTGSGFPPGSTIFRADLDGVLIGFVHSPSPVIESVSGAGVGRWGDIILNPNLGLEPETPVTLTVKALSPTPAR